MWRTVRKASKISKDERDLFERYGENVIGMVLASNVTPAAGPLTRIKGNDETLEHAGDWLTERADAHEQREQRLEILEWTIVGLIILEIVLSVYRELH